MHYEMLVGVLFRGDTGSYWFTPFCSENLVFHALAGRMGQIVLLMAVWDRRTRQTRWDGCGMEGLALAGAGSGAQPFALEMRQAAGSGRCHQFYRCCRGSRAFFSV